MMVRHNGRHSQTSSLPSARPLVTRTTCRSSCSRSTCSLPSSQSSCPSQKLVIGLAHQLSPHPQQSTRGLVDPMALSSGGGALRSYGPQFWWGGSSSGPCMRQGRCNGRMGDRCTAALLATLLERSACERLCVAGATHGTWAQGQLPPCGQAMATATSGT